MMHEGLSFTPVALTVGTWLAITVAASPVEAKSQFEVEGCVPFMNDAMPAAADAAVSRAASCLGGARGLNAKLATAIKKIARSGKVTLRCSDQNLKGHGRTERLPGGKVRISVDTPNFSSDEYQVTAGDRTNVKAQKSEALRARLAELLFHELIHAVDVKHRYVNSSEIHNSATGAPDVVYSCHLACYPGRAEKPGANMMNARKTLNIPIDLPERKTFPCPFEGEGPCRALRRYAYVCHAGKPVKVTPK
ncbi:MAG: hypothetical protein HYY84_08165 [Deltaproteobacteria bacterium]|nr:hypothetical protein [Deltaproteobacteria bacterium]